MEFDNYNLLDVMSIYQRDTAIQYQEENIVDD